MKITKYLIPIILVIVLVGIYLVLRPNKPSENNIQVMEYTTMGSGKIEGDFSLRIPSFKFEEVEQHNTHDDCWFVINGQVYDVTRYMSLHPGKEAIFEGCGIDATELYETRPMGSGTPHSKYARELLREYFIGDLETTTEDIEIPQDIGNTKPL